MAFESLHQLLAILEQQATWSDRHLFADLNQAWTVAIGEKFAPHTKPLGIQEQQVRGSLRRVLRVATSSAALSQTLTLQRRQILNRLNEASPLVVDDLRFEPARWYDRRDRDGLPTMDPHQHPSYMGERAAIPEGDRATVSDPQTAFQQWAATIQRRSQSLPTCPRCGCPTPSGELERWSACAPCAVRHMQGAERSQVTPSPDSRHTDPRHTDPRHTDPRHKPEP